MIKISFHGGVQGVTGSRHLISVNGRSVLLDCGLFQGRRRDTYEKNLNFSFDPQNLEALILSHAHIDHIGNAPNLVKQGFGGDIHCTLATADLASVMLNDSAKIHESDAAFASKVRARHGEPPVEPLYTARDIPPTLELIEGHSYNRPFNVSPGVRALFRDAGHILGSAITMLDISDEGRKLSVCFTGDLGRENMPIIRNPEYISGADVLIIESTYGNRLHGDINESKKKLAAVINETVAHQGKVIVPSFALERTQDLIYNLHLLKLAKEIPDIPVYVDSPLAIDATDVFRLHPECFDDATRELMQTVEDPFGFRHLHYTRTSDESKKLNFMDGPMIIIACSGMAESGRILHHLKNNIGSARNTVLIVGWQAENTLGRRIAEKQEVVSIFGEKYPLKSNVVVFDEFSSHADRNDLLRWAGKGKWRKIFVVHGEKEASASFARDLEEMGFADVNVPGLGESVTI
ncbi:MAG: MBL fold metallo-hydrolase [Chloroflexota bacterium]